MQMMIKLPKPVGDSYSFRDELPTTDKVSKSVVAFPRCFSHVNHTVNEMIEKT